MRMPRHCLAENEGDSSLSMVRQPTPDSGIVEVWDYVRPTSNRNEEILSQWTWSMLDVVAEWIERMRADPDFYSDMPPRQTEVGAGDDRGVRAGQ